MRARGYKIYLDDFGSGYSSICYLRDLTSDAIKLDKSFTSTVELDNSQARLVPPMLAMAKELGVPMIVEGVETEGQARFFLERQVTLMQGWLYGRAVETKELISQLRTQ